MYSNNFQIVELRKSELLAVDYVTVNVVFTAQQVGPILCIGFITITSRLVKHLVKEDQQRHVQLNSSNVSRLNTDWNMDSYMHWNAHIILIYPLMQEYYTWNDMLDTMGMQWVLF